MNKLTKLKDPNYTASIFNVLLWWKNGGSKLFPELGTGAAIMFGKPTHNAFQEQVFTWGVYQDNVLKKICVRKISRCGVEWCEQKGC
jgi:hypothetical protein